MSKRRSKRQIVELEAPRRVREREVTPEEAELWQAVARSIAPLHKASAAPPERPPQLRRSRLAPVLNIGTPISRPAPPPKPQRKADGDQAMQPFEPKRARRLAKGKLPIEARLDLHGHRQSDAHAALLRFLLDAHARGLRHVKIITGKGSPGDTDRERSPWPEPEAERGVLRRMVPIWLGEPALRAIVVSHTTAGRGHGGEGALYVQLRRRERHKNRNEA